MMDMPLSNHEQDKFPKLLARDVYWTYRGSLLERIGGGKSRLLAPAYPRMGDITHTIT